jgi:nitrous oxidase accessory protein NosD
MKTILAGALTLGALISASPAFAATLSVCAHKCASTTIQGAIDLAAAGDTIDVGPGTYVENVVVDRSLTLRGSGDDSVILPAVSNPSCSGGSLCGGAASTLILVEASDVTITGFLLEGDNAALTSGVVVGGADVDARNGIVTNQLLGVYQRLTVSDVVVRDVYFRGIYASSGGSFTFTGNRVDNVQGDASSVAIFNYGGSGLISGNTVTRASDAISSNGSTGTRYLNNEVRLSGSGVHTDNNGWFGGVGDVIRGNAVEDCTLDGYGLWTFGPYLEATFERNTVRGCSVGMAAFGSSATTTTTFRDNAVDGAGATSSAGQGSLGAWVSTTLFTYGFAPVAASLQGNRIEHFDTGVLVDQTLGAAAAATLHGDTIDGNETGANGLPGTTVDATLDWWGCKAGPNHKGCDTAIGTVDFTPWLTAKP